MTTVFLSADEEDTSTAFRLEQDEHMHVTAVQLDPSGQPDLATSQELGIWGDINSAVVREVLAARLGLFE